MSGYFKRIHGKTFYKFEAALLHGLAGYWTEVSISIAFRIWKAYLLNGLGMNTAAVLMIIPSWNYVNLTTKFYRRY